MSAHEAAAIDAVALPAGAEPPIRVYVNGAELRPERDYRIEDGVVRFARPLRPPPRLGLGRKLMLAVGIGVYGDLRGDTLDVHYQLGGRPQSVTNVRLGAPAPPAGDAPG